MGTLVPGDGYVDTASVGGMLLGMDTDRTPWILWAGPMESILGEGSREMSKDSVVAGEGVEVSVLSSRRMLKSVMAWRSESVRTWSGVLGAFSMSSAIVLETGGDGRCAVPALLPGWQAYITSVWALRGVDCLQGRGVQVGNWTETGFYTNWTGEYRCLPPPILSSPPRPGW